MVMKKRHQSLLFNRFIPVTRIFSIVYETNNEKYSNLFFKYEDDEFDNDLFSFFNLNTYRLNPKKKTFQHIYPLSHINITHLSNINTLQK